MLRVLIVSLLVFPTFSHAAQCPPFSEGDRIYNLFGNMPSILGQEVMYRFDATAAFDLQRVERGSNVEDLLATALYSLVFKTLKGNHLALSNWYEKVYVGQTSGRLLDDSYLYEHKDEFTGSRSSKSRTEISSGEVFEKKELPLLFFNKRPTLSGSYDDEAAFTAAKCHWYPFVSEFDIQLNLINVETNQKASLTDKINPNAEYYAIPLEVVE